ncbi:hypothetical protein M0805_008940 [Coniferiporia weirii]|nr:hypothetical protein M0805_008940 [Coniferiporia weirii]
MSQAQCPVDHAASSQPDKCPVNHAQLAQASQADKCPVDHKTRSTWGGLVSPPSDQKTPPHPHAPASLPTDREVSSIPRADGEKWVYPSQAQFFAAMARKQHNPQEQDMRVVVPIHNAVNERAWGEVLGWERGWGSELCGGVKLVSFKGRPKDMSPRARFKSLLGYQAPFDRHDWIVDRCGTRMRYVIDFYTGKSPLGGNLAFYLDVRPAFDNWEAVKMRASRFWERWVGPLPLQSSNGHPSSPAQSKSSGS